MTLRTVSRRLHQISFSPVSLGSLGEIIKGMRLKPDFQPCIMYPAVCFFVVVVGGWWHKGDLLSVFSREMESSGHSQCLTCCDLMDCSPPGSSVHGIFQARILEWVSHSLLQEIFLTQGLDLSVSHCRLIHCPLSYQGSPLET